MKTWRLSLLAAVAVLGLQGCDQQPPQTVVKPPQVSLPDDTVLRGDASQQAGAAPPAAAASAAVAAASAPAAAASAPIAAASAAQVASDVPQDAGAATVAPGMEPAPPQTGAMGGPGAATNTAGAATPPAQGMDAPPGGQGTAAMTEMWRAYPPAGSGTQASAAAPAASAPQAGAPAPTSAASAPQKISGLPAVADPGDAQGSQLLAQRPLEVPVVGIVPTRLSDNYTQTRGSRKHEAIDILAPAGTPVVAVDDGRVAKLFTSKAGGLTVYQFDPSSHLAYYYAHLQRYADGLREGMDLRRGDLIGYVGTSGNADPGTPHLHFAVFRLGDPPKWWQGAPVNPYPALSRAQPAQQVASR